MLHRDTPFIDEVVFILSFAWFASVCVDAFTLVLQSYECRTPYT